MPEKLKVKSFWERLLFNIGLSVAKGNFPKFDIDDACQNEEVFRFLNDDEIKMIDELPAAKVKAFEKNYGLPAGTLEEMKRKPSNIYLISKFYDFCDKKITVKSFKRMRKGEGIPLPAYVRNAVLKHSVDARKEFCSKFDFGFNRLKYALFSNGNLYKYDVKLVKEYFVKGITDVEVLKCTVNEYFEHIAS
jgi:hypothetical protein